MALRILHLDSGREWRGGQRQVFLLAAGLREDGYEPLVVAPPESPLLHRARARGLATVAVPMRGDWDFVAARRVHAVLRTWAADVVHAHDARAHAISLAALMRRRELPLVVTRRVPFTPSSVRLKYGSRVSRFIAISRAVRDAMVRAGIAPGRIEVVYSGVPAPRVNAARDWRAECDWATETVLCGVVGAMTSEKGIDALADIARHLPPDVRPLAGLVLVGGTSTGRCTIGEVPAVRAGFVEDVHDAMAGLDMLWHPARAEGLGTAVIDAMALGVPPVAFRVGGLPELIEHERSGMLVPPGDPGAFAASVARLIGDRSFREGLARGAVERARQFDVRHMVDGTERVYRRILSSQAV